MEVSSKLVDAVLLCLFKALDLLLRGHDVVADPFATIFDFVVFGLFGFDQFREVGDALLSFPATCMREYDSRSSPSKADILEVTLSGLDLFLHPLHVQVQPLTQLATTILKLGLLRSDPLRQPFDRSVALLEGIVHLGDLGLERIR